MKWFCYSLLYSLLQTDFSYFPHHLAGYFQELRYRGVVFQSIRQHSAPDDPDVPLRAWKVLICFFLAVTSCWSHFWRQFFASNQRCSPQRGVLHHLYHMISHKRLPITAPEMLFALFCCVYFYFSPSNSTLNCLSEAGSLHGIAEEQSWQRCSVCERPGGIRGGGGGSHIVGDRLFPHPIRNDTLSVGAMGKPSFCLWYLF